MKVQLELRPLSKNGNPEYVHTRHKKSEPFLDNPRAVLIHRVRSWETITYPTGRHDVFVLWCGGSFNSRGAVVQLAKVPKGRLLCERCEYEASRKHKPSADKICGRHVHVGGVRAYQTCCQDTLGRN